MNDRRQRGLRLRVEVTERPDPLLLPAAIRARLAGRPFPAGPEDAVAAALVKAVRPALEQATPARGERTWR